MKKTLTILLALLLLGVQQGIASEKQKKVAHSTHQAKSKKTVAKDVNSTEGSPEESNQWPINIVAIHEFLLNEGYAPEWRDNGEVKYLTFKYQGQGMFVVVDKEFVLLQTGFDKLTPFITARTKQKALTENDFLAIFLTCMELSHKFKVIKFDYDAEVDIAFMKAETFMPSMDVFKRYFDLYMRSLKLASEVFEQKLNKELGISQ